MNNTDLDTCGAIADNDLNPDVLPTSQQSDAGVELPDCPLWQALADPYAALVRRTAESLLVAL